MSADKDQAPQDEQLARTAQISQNIRKAVRAAFPAPADQFFTMMIPGKVVNLDVSRLRKSRMYPSQLTSSSRDSPKVSTTTAIWWNRRCLSMSSSMKPCCATICLLFLVSSSVLRVNPSRGAMPPLSANFAPPVGDVYISHSPPG